MPLVLGYHGRDKETAQKLLSGSSFVHSNNAYDWLGTGVYFWESDLVRAYEWAKERRPHGPCVVGAAIELGNCLDLTTRTGIEAVKQAHASYVQLQQAAGKSFPINRATTSSGSSDLVLRFLDHAVIDHLHATYKVVSQLTDTRVREFDTVRASFPEGAPLYEDAGFWEKTHVQIAVRIPQQIKGIFRTPDYELQQLSLPALYQFS